MTEKNVPGHTPTPLPDELVDALQSSEAAAFTHDIVMDAIDVSMALDRHVMLYGLEGLFLLETDEASWRLPPSRAAWVPAGTHVKATTINRVRCAAVYLREDFAPALAPTLTVFEATPVVREMFKHTRAWTPQMETTPERERFLRTLVDLCREQIGPKSLFSLPKARSAELRGVLAYTRSKLAEPLRLDDVAKEAAMSPRTLMRRVKDEIGMTWGQYLHAARMIRAMEHLARGLQVTRTAYEVGYATPAAFTNAFRRYANIAPSAYREQV